MRIIMGKNKRAMLNSDIALKENETLLDFKNRITKLKSYNEEFLIKNLYEYIDFSNDLEQIVLDDKKENADLIIEIGKQKGEIEDLKEIIEKWRDMFTKVSLTNAKLINKE